MPRSPPTPWYAHSSPHLSIKHSAKHCTGHLVFATQMRRPQLLSSRHGASKLVLCGSAAQETGILIHSIFVGIAYGAETDYDTIRALTIALGFHQVRQLLCAEASA